MAGHATRARPCRCSNVIPDLFRYRRHKRIDNIDLNGVSVPGLRGEFLRRDLGERIATVGLYSYYGQGVFMAWGYVGEAHCRYTSMYDAAGDWEPAQPGCPEVRVLDDGTATGPIGLATRSAAGNWVVHLAVPTEAVPAEPPPAPCNADSGSRAGRTCPVVLLR